MKGFCFLEYAVKQQRELSLPKRFDPQLIEPALQSYWLDAGIFQFDPDREEQLFSIDTPPPTISGKLHLGHVYSYAQTDFVARFWRMRGFNVLYPMGFDDNGLPTERLVEKELGIRATDLDRMTFVEKCMQVCEAAEQEYERLWKRLGLSVDWRYVYRTIDERSRRIAQVSFLDLLSKDLIYRREAPTIWCPECQTAIAQAELDDLERDAELYTISFPLKDGQAVPIATTRPELLPACVAVFIHPEDERLQGLIDREARVPIFDHIVPILADPAVNPDFGTGIVMSCTFGDTEDIAWWHRHHLPLRIVLGKDGRLGAAAGEFSGLSPIAARQKINESLQERGLLLGSTPLQQSVRVHERCDTPVEYIVTNQWFIRILDRKSELLDAGERVQWHPEHMRGRYKAWVENLQWDWCISRQRFYGVPFPVWYCKSCAEPIFAERDQLPVDPLESEPAGICECGTVDFEPEEDVMDTWMTSSHSPQILNKLLEEAGVDTPIIPMSLRPQAHEIIRTWAFYTIVKSLYLEHEIPWHDIAISGWGLLPEGMGKISKSRGGGPISPLEMIDLYSADALRYWAASSSLGRDSLISEQKIQYGAKLTTKLWNVSRFAQAFLAGHPFADPPPLTSPIDKWLLSRIQHLIHTVTQAWEQFDHLTAKNATEHFFWHDLADNYIELAKRRLYSEAEPGREAARYTLHQALLTVLKLFAPFLPFITEEIYQRLFCIEETKVSIHRSSWPEADPNWIDLEAELLGNSIIHIVSGIRRYKSERHLSLATEIAWLQLATADGKLRKCLTDADIDIKSATRARRIEVVDNLNPDYEEVEIEGDIHGALSMDLRVS
jgi:valyl-tRNA synthetase